MKKDKKSPSKVKDQPYIDDNDYDDHQRPVQVSG
jgi:hypothetical protein